MAGVLGQERLQNESGNAQQWQESAGRKAMMTAEWGNQLSSFSFFILARSNPQVIPALCSKEETAV
jgi:hypothetical protein